MTSLTKASSNLNRQGRQWLQPTRQIPTEFKNSSPCFISQEQTSPTVTTTGSRWASLSPAPSVRAVGPTSTTSAPSTVDTMPGKPTKSTTNASAQRMDVLTSQRSSIWQSRPECHSPNTNTRRPKPQRDTVTKMSPCHFGPKKTKKECRACLSSHPPCTTICHPCSSLLSQT